MGTVLLGDLAQVAAKDLRAWATALGTEAGAAAEVTGMSQAARGPVGMHSFMDLNAYKRQLVASGSNSPAVAQAVEAVGTARLAARPLAFVREAQAVIDPADVTKARGAFEDAAKALDDIGRAHADVRIEGVNDEVSTHVAANRDAFGSGTFNGDFDDFQRLFDEQQANLRAQADAARATKGDVYDEMMRMSGQPTRAERDAAAAAEAEASGMPSGSLSEQLAWAINPNGGSSSIADALRSAVQEPTISPGVQRFARKFLNL